jgi:superfamily II DNA or RNA helicase
VGIGKTIEAGLIARELIDRGEIKRLAVICPPYLCDQWQSELKNKFNLDAVIIRSNTLAGLERELPRPGLSVFEYYRNIIVSIDYVKSDRLRDAFLVNSPEFIIVDEAHGCAKPGGVAASQQQRHDFLKRLADLKSKHLILVTATPHSGVEESFKSLLGLINKIFGQVDIGSATDEGLTDLVKHFVQRRRADVKGWMDTDTPFPERIPLEEAFSFSSEYKKLFEDVYKFCCETVVSSETQSGSRRRVQYWAALSLLRCVMSSPAAASAALRSRIGGVIDEESDDPEDFSIYVMDPTEVENIVDVAPTRLVNNAEERLGANEKRKLRDFAKRAEQLLTGDKDVKLARTSQLVERLLTEKYNPIVFCRFIATADYVANQLKERLAKKFRNLEVKSVTGALSEEERQFRVRLMSESTNPHVLVATDCLSEGLSLQDGFSAIIHYDLPWNPNRLEQREGRVDRFGQTSSTVKTILLYGQDSPIDAAVLNVLLRKARKIHKTLGITVPVPVDSEGILETLLQALFFKGGSDLNMARQVDLFEEDHVVKLKHHWDISVERERASRTRFAQRAIKPNEIQQELTVTDNVLGDPSVVQRFVIEACRRLGAAIENGKDFFTVNPAGLPPGITDGIPAKSNRISFGQPCPGNTTYVSRNHVFVRSLCEHILGKALDRDGDRLLASRCGIIRSNDVSSLTTLIILRARFLVESSVNPTLAEESIVSGFSGIPPSEKWYSPTEALKLLDTVTSSGNVSDAEKREWLNQVLGKFDDINSKIVGMLTERASELQQAHERLRKTIKSQRVNIKPLFPPDVVALSIILPRPGR